MLIDPDEHGHALIDCAADNGRTDREESEAYAIAILTALDDYTATIGAKP